VASLTNLEVLAIEHLKLDTIPPQLSRLKNLKKFLFKAGNPLKSIHKDILSRDLVSFMNILASYDKRFVTYTEYF
jgi:hypothetical protein